MPELMNLNCILINQNIVPKHQHIFIIEKHVYLCLYNGFDDNTF